ncbi:hypothetical protein [Bradyrhizobium sp. USDA 4454]
MRIAQKNAGLQVLDQLFHLVDALCRSNKPIASNPVAVLNPESAPCLDRVKVADRPLQAVLALCRW